MNREAIKNELLEKLAAATKTTMVGDQAVQVMQAQALVEEALTRGTNLGHMKALDIVGSRRLELACMIAGHLAQKLVVDKVGEISCMEECARPPGSVCRDALEILDTMVDLINGDAK